MNEFRIHKVFYHFFLLLTILFTYVTKMEIPAKIISIEIIFRLENFSLRNILEKTMIKI